LQISDELTNYIAFLHDVVSAYHERLSEVTSAQVATEFLANIADKEVRYLKLDKQADRGFVIDSLLNRMGIHYKLEKTGEMTTISLSCPYASTVHPRINSTHPICPISILALGAERINDTRLIVTQNHLTRSGAEYTIAPRANRR
jgi:hypothetical protein